MDESRLDAIAKTLSAGHTRRDLARLLGGVSLGGALCFEPIRGAAAALLNGGIRCKRGSQCKTGKCLGSGKCSCSSKYPTCKQPSNPCKQAACNVATHRCVTMNRDNGAVKTCGVGGCQRTVQQCIDGQEQSCTPGTPSSEVCNGIDDDCDGVIDNGASCADECAPHGGGCNNGSCICAL